MPLHRRGRHPALPGPHLTLFFAFLAIVCLAGGASRPDAFGQAVVRGAAAAALITLALFADHRAIERPRAVVAILGAAIALTIAQLVPLPPGAWQALPGHAIFAGAATGAQPWRPLSIQPGATLNALMSLIVPVACAGVLANLAPADRAWTLPALLVLIVVSATIGLLQLSGSGFDNPFINDVPGEVSGLLANRNHLALLLAIGCLLAPVWAVLDRARFSWRVPLALGLVVLFILLILGSGSRAGTAIGAAAVLLGLGMSYRDGRQLVRKWPRWTGPAVVAATLVVLAGAVYLSFSADRAQSISRTVAMATGEDLRVRALPTVIDMVGTYLPTGAGFGTFATSLQIYEPFELLKLTYFNHAHNDFLELALDGGLPALALLGGALLWWLWASWRIWRRERSPRVIRGQLGSATIALVLIASAFDYPARTPVIMAVLVIATLWLSWGLAPSSRDPLSTLPPEARPL